MMNFYSCKKVLVTGGTGMIGQPLCEMLIKAGAHVTVASLDSPERAPVGTSFRKLDLRSFDNCMAVTDGQDIVFHLAGVKGSPKMTAERPASFFVPTLQFSLNMMEAARRNGVGSYLFTSSVGVYQPADVFFEDSVWITFPSPNDRFAGWAKRMCELQAEAYKIEYGWDRISIVRPANVYGPFDNFDPANAMVIPSLIHRALTEDGPLLVWGDGSPIRDFIHARDVARGMMQVVEKGVNEPVNLGSGDGVTIRDIAESIAKATGKELVWDTGKPRGDAKRLMDVTRARSYGIQSEVDLEEGIAETIEWYKKFKTLANARYNSFTEPELYPK
ncbi:MAG: NAD-dependent epimerase/dehydratase family protein [Leptolyngbyaceae bacterium]|nr:NAD-dependent epimerase/dehydratase family protein [Leptolyngbyaceae bacterium]